MPDTFIRFSDMKDSHPSPIDGANDLLAIAHKDINSATGYNSMTVTPNALGAHAVEDQTFVNLETGAKTVEGAINQTLGNFANKYDATQQYAVDDCVLYAGILYKCIVAIATPEAWDSTHWEQIKAIDVGSGGGGGGSADHITLTQAEYDALVEAGTVDPDAFYFIEDGYPSAYTITVLNGTPNLFSNNTEIALSDDFDNYDELKFYLCMYDSVLFNHFEVITVPKDVLQKSYNDYNDSSITYQYKGRFELTRSLSASGTFYASSWQVIANTKNTLLSATKGVQGWTENTCYIYKVVGIKYDTFGAGSGHVYSTSEKSVGAWIDSSPVYEKTFVINTPSAGINSIAHNISNLGDVISIEGTAIRSNGAMQPLGFISSANNYGWNVTVYDFTTSNFSLEVGAQLSLSKVVVTVRYTKTST